MFGFGKKQTRQVTAEEQRSLADPSDLDFSILGAIPSTSGVIVSASNALAVPAVAAGVKAIAEAVGTLPLHTYRRSDDDSRERDTEHTTTSLLNGRANPWTLGPQLRELLTADAIACGNGYALIVRDGTGEPKELHRLHPPTVSIEIDTATGEPSYRAKVGAGTRLIASKDRDAAAAGIGDLDLYRPSALRRREAGPRCRATSRTSQEEAGTKRHAEMEGRVMRTDGKHKSANAKQVLAEPACNILKSFREKTPMARPRGVEPLFPE